jgi:hypothetical protein
MTTLFSFEEKHTHPPKQLTPQKQIENEIECVWLGGALQKQNAQPRRLTHPSLKFDHLHEFECSTPQGRQNYALIYSMLNVRL